MGLHTILENDNQCQAGYARKSVHPAQHQCSKGEERNDKKKSTGRDYVMKNLDADLRGMEFDSSSSPYRRSMPSRPVGMDVQDDAVTRRRGSVYQSSREVRKMKKLQEDSREARFDKSSEDFLSFEIVNSSSLRRRDEGRSSVQKKRSPLIPSSKNPSLTSLDTTGTVMTNSSDFLDLSFRFLPEEQCTTSTFLPGSATSKQDRSDDLLEISLSTEDPSCCSTANSDAAEKGSLEAFKLSRNDGNLLSEWDKRHFLPKSFSAKMGMHTSLNQPDDDALRDSPKSRFGSHKGIGDPIMKSQSLRNPSLSEAEVVSTPKIDSGNIKKNKAFHKSLLNDFSWATQRPKKTGNDAQPNTRDQAVLVALSPVHLSGILKLERRNGATLFEFLPKDSEETLSANAWRTNSAFNWVYTFHRNRNKNSSISWGMKDRYTLPSLLIGQMQVSCYLCSEINNNQSLDNSTVMEFTLYDIAQARRSFASEEKSHSPAEAIQPLKDAIDKSLATANSSKTNDSEKNKLPARHALGDGKLDASDSHPWAPADLVPHLEIAAIVIQFPYEPKGKLRNRKEDKACAKEYPDLCSVSVIDQGTKTFSNSLYSANMKVITPSGSHGLPCTEGCPSPLFDRWRSGGGCDCGGWDMGCPIVVFDNNSRGHAADATIHQSLKLFTQGTKDTIPDLTMTRYEEGQYSVHFHAKFSALQAFSICVATLHALEPSTMIEHDTSMPILHTKSLKLLLEEEVRHLLGAVAEKEKLKAKKSAVEPLPACYMLDPPFSPIARV